jgi:serine/threonine protein kinase
MSSGISSVRTLASRERIEPPVEFGKFLLTERIGEGGMAQAFRATMSWAEGVAKEVCVKRILSPLAADPRTRAMFVQEARIAASLTHANIVPVYEFGVVDEYYFLAMEYVDGFTLREIMMHAARRGTWLRLPVVLHLICEALEGLDYAHRKRDADGLPLEIVHRDVTPGNVMASVEGEVKLLDFGIAAIASGSDETDPSAKDASTAGIGRGKPGYVSPEQAVGMAVDSRSDIYSVGILLYEMLTHRRLFQVKTIGERLKLSTKIEPPSAVNRDLPADLDPLVMKAIVANPADRYHSAASLRDALLDYMHDHGLRAGRSQLAESLAALFEVRPAAGLIQRPWETDIRTLGGEGLARPPAQRRRRPTEGRISTTVAQVSIDSLKQARRKRWRAGLTIALVFSAVLGALGYLVHSWF